MLFDLNKKYIVITGGNSGNGKAMLDAVIEHNGRAIVIDKTENKNEAEINVFSHLVTMFLMCALFYFLCAYEYQTAAWILLLFPLLIFIFIMIWIFGIIAVTGDKKKKEQEKEEEEKKESLKAYEATNNLAKF